jgi:riboflavin biosynthesis pyrimidine reductase
MIESIDGKATGEFLETPEGIKSADAYFKKEYSFGCKSIITGRTTFESVFTEEIDLSKFKDSKIDKKDFVAEKKNGYYSVIIDKQGKIKWKESFFCYWKEYDRNQESQMITILAEDEVKDDYLAYLQSIGVSYIFAGKNNIDLKTALKKLKSLFGIDKLLLEGGPTTNQPFFKENLVTKIFLIKTPIISQSGSKNVFGDACLSFWKLENCEILDDKSTLLLSYSKVK